MSQSNNDSGPPDWAEGSNVTESDGTVSVGPDPQKQAEQQAKNGQTQLDRIEGMLRVLLARSEE